MPNVREIVDDVLPWNTERLTSQNTDLSRPPN
jgi:hypothetical protein